MADSPLTDGSTYTRALESAYRRVWAQWIGHPQSNLRSAHRRPTHMRKRYDDRSRAVVHFAGDLLGEGTFLSLLWFLERHAPDPVTAAVCRLAAQDEARHVAFGVAHLREQVSQEPGILPKLANAVRRRHDVLRNTAGLNAEVFDALLLVASGGWEPAELRRGTEQVMRLVREMDELRQKRMVLLGFGEEEAQELSSLHTRNFM